MEVNGHVQGPILMPVDGTLDDYLLKTWHDGRATYDALFLQNWSNDTKVPPPPSPSPSHHQPSTTERSHWRLIPEGNHPKTSSKSPLLTDRMQQYAYNIFFLFF
jgi:hypothetical protein